MDLLIFALVIVLVVALLVWAVRSIPSMPPTLSWIVQLVIILIGALVILMKSGLLHG